MTRGARHWRFSSLHSRRLAAPLSRRLWTSTSSTMPSWSTARHSQCFLPAILRATSSRCHLSPAWGSLRRIWLAKSWPNLRAHCRTLSWLTMMPRAASISSTMRKLRGPSQSWGSGGHRQWRVWVVGRQELLPETGAERAVVEGAADLEQPIGPAPGPAHLLRLGHAAVHQEVGLALGQRRADPLPGPVPFGVIDQMGALGA